MPAVTSPPTKPEMFGMRATGVRGRSARFICDTVSIGKVLNIGSNGALPMLFGDTPAKRCSIVAFADMTTSLISSSETDALLCKLKMSLFIAPTTLALRMESPSSLSDAKLMREITSAP